MLKQVLFAKPTRKIVDVLGSPLTLLSAFWLRYIRSRTVKEMPVSKVVFDKVGVFPIADHYYEPLFNTRNLKPFTERKLAGLDFRVQEQLDLLSKFSYQEELKKFPMDKPGELTYYYNNGS